MLNNFTSACRGHAILLVTLLSCFVLKAQVPPLIFQPVITGLTFPVDVANAGDGSNRIFIAHQGGLIKVYNQAYTFLGDFLTVTGISTGGERGLLSIAFHPNYESNRFFYVYYTNTNGDIEIARYQTLESNPNLADAGSKQIVITIPHPGQSNHNGGKLNFGSEPGAMLYFATGDGGAGDDPPNNAQNGNVLLGKMIRISVNTSTSPPFYSVPADNPFVGNPAVLDEIWALGLRNPFRWSFDRSTNDIWIGDVGQNQMEEIDFRAAGSTGGVNYGWSCFEGSLPHSAGCNPPSSYVFPVSEYPNPNGAGNPPSAVTGGIVYRGTEFPALNGYYLAADYYSGTVFRVKQEGSTFTTTPQTGLPNSVSAFGEAEDGTAFALSQNGVLYKILTTAQAPTPVKLISFTLRQENNFNQVNWKTALEINAREFSLESSNDGINFTEVGKVPASQQPNGSSYSFRHFITADKKLYYRLNSIDNDGSSEYSRVISTVAKTGEGPIKLYPPTSSSVLVQLNKSVNAIRILNVFGQVIHRQTTGNVSGLFYINTFGWKNGVYVLIADTNEGPSSQKFLLNNQ